MPYGDLRQFLERLEAEGELRRVGAEVDWNLELGAISRRGQDLRSPAMLFENVRGYPGGRVLANLIGPTRPVPHGRLALALDLPLRTPTLELIEAVRPRLKRRIPPRRVTAAPCKEVVLRGDDIDLWRLPVPFIHGTDGGRYLGTWHVDVTRDPDSGWVNWGMYRHQVHDERRLGWMSSPAQHGMAQYLQKYEARGERMPFAIAIGTEPISSVVAGSQVPQGVPEADVVGGLRGEPVDVIRCETVDLDVPAGAEIVIEGFVLPNERYPEGNFGEFTGYAAGSCLPRHVVHVECITHRRDPILTISNMGKPWDEFGVIASITQSAFLANELHDRGIPFSAIYSPPPITTVVVACRPPYAGFVQTLAHAIWSSKPGIYRPYIIAVEDDVDVTDAEDVMWCLTTRLHPREGIHVQRHTPALQLWPFLSQQEREQRDGSKVLFDATFPLTWPPEEIPTVIDLEHAWPADVRQRVLARWPEFGLDR